MQPDSTLDANNRITKAGSVSRDESVSELWPAETELRSKLSPRLSKHLSSVPLERLSRIPLSRFSSKALPHISQIELVSGPDFADFYDELYIQSFTRRTERESSKLIVDRLIADFANNRTHLAPYRIVGIRDHKNEAIGAAQFSLLKLPHRNGSARGRVAVPYLQYIYVRAENRRQDMAELLHTMVLAVSAADVATNTNDQDADDVHTVPFTLFETEPPGYGKDEESRLISRERIKIHTRSGSVALMLQHSKSSSSSQYPSPSLDTDDGSSLHSPHVQPGLEIGDPPLTLIWAIRPSPAFLVSDPSTSITTKSNTESPDSTPDKQKGSEPPVFGYDIENTGADLLQAYYQSLRDEGFPEENIVLAEQIALNRCKGRKFVLAALEDIVPSIVKSC